MLGPFGTSGWLVHWGHLHRVVRFPNPLRNVTKIWIFSIRGVRMGGRSTPLQSFFGCFFLVRFQWGWYAGASAVRASWHRGKLLKCLKWGGKYCFVYTYCRQGKSHIRWNPPVYLSFILSLLSCFSEHLSATFSAWTKRKVKGSQFKKRGQGRVSTHWVWVVWGQVGSNIFSTYLQLSCTMCTSSRSAAEENNIQIWVSETWNTAQSQCGVNIYAATYFQFSCTCSCCGTRLIGAYKQQKVGLITEETWILDFLF